MSADEAHVALGRVAIRAADGPMTFFDTPMSSRGKAAATAALAPLGACGAFVLVADPSGFSLVAAALCLATTPISVPAGAIYGAIAAQRPEYIERGVRELETAVTELQTSALPRDLVVIELTKRYRDVPGRTTRHARPAAVAAGRGHRGPGRTALMPPVAAR